MSCSDATPRENQVYFSPANTGIKCKTITHTNTLKHCENGVKEVINATNIIIYE